MVHSESFTVPVIAFPKSSLYKSSVWLTQLVDQEHCCTPSRIWVDDEDGPCKLWENVLLLQNKSNYSVLLFYLLQLFFQSAFSGQRTTTLLRVPPRQRDNAVIRTRPSELLRPNLWILRKILLYVTSGGGQRAVWRHTVLLPIGLQQSVRRKMLSTKCSHGRVSHHEHARTTNDGSLPIIRCAARSKS